MEPEQNSNDAALNEELSRRLRTTLYGESETRNLEQPGEESRPEATTETQPEAKAQPESSPEGEQEQANTEEAEPVAEEATEQETPEPSRPQVPEPEPEFTGDEATDEEIRELLRAKRFKEEDITTYPTTVLQRLAFSEDRTSALEAQGELMRRAEESLKTQKKYELQRVRKQLEEKRYKEQHAAELREAELKERVRRGDDQAFGELLALRRAGANASNEQEEKRRQEYQEKLAKLRELKALRGHRYGQEN